MIEKIERESSSAQDAVRELGFYTARCFRRVGSNWNPQQPANFEHVSVCSFCVCLRYCECVLMAAGWRELCLSREVEELVLTRLRASELSGRMLAGVQRELVTSRNEGAGRARAIAADFIKTSGPQQLRHTKKKIIFAGFEVQLKNLVFHQLER